MIYADACASHVGEAFSSATACKDIYWSCEKGNLPRDIEKVPEISKNWWGEL
jgi:hypothetical protein